LFFFVSCVLDGKPLFFSHSLIHLLLHSIQFCRLPSGVGVYRISSSLLLTLTHLMLRYILSGTDLQQVIYLVVLYTYLSAPSSSLHCPLEFVCVSVWEEG
jgi:hypothetical protein